LKTRGTVAKGRDRLAPHEAPTTDVVLLGHSMGGLLTSEVMLLPPNPPDGRTFRHRVLGTVNFDVPFLGMHPGVITTGIASIFAPAAPAPPTQDPVAAGSTASSQSSTLALAPPDLVDAEDPLLAQANALFAPPPAGSALFNAPYANDVRLPPPRKGWRSALHFLHKHAEDGLRHAAAQYVRSHAEFGGAMADYRGLRARYMRVRALEEQEEGVRVRFVNYYTACWGRPKRENEADGSPAKGISGTPGSEREGARSPLVFEDGAGSEAVAADPERAGEPNEQRPDVLGLVDSEATAASSSDSVGGPLWPPLSPLRAEPAAPDYTAYADKPVQDALRREHERRVKAHRQAAKDREATLAERKKVEEKMRKAAAKAAGKNPAKSEDNEKNARQVEAVPSAESDPTASSVGDVSLSSTQREGSEHGRRSRSGSPLPGQKKKDKKFCMLPPKDDMGQRDPTWVRVFMADMDEVTAHTSLFIMSEAYERLVGDVGARIEEWVRQSGH
jgi:pimeloyl-ACP methyl ester carboxylesterase